jgi:hypothetical protein
MIFWIALSVSGALFLGKAIAHTYTRTQALAKHAVRLIAQWKTNTKLHLNDFRLDITSFHSRENLAVTLSGSNDSRAMRRPIA